MPEEYNVVVDKNVRDREDVGVKSDFKDVDFYNPNNGTVGRDGGPYLDEVEMAGAERQRAAREGREPVTLTEHLDPKNDKTLPATAGVPLVTKEVLASMAVVSSAYVSDKDFVKPHSTLAVDVASGETSEEAPAPVTDQQGDVKATPSATQVPSKTSK